VLCFWNGLNGYNLITQLLIILVAYSAQKSFLGLRELKLHRKCSKLHNLFSSQNTLTTIK